MGWNPSRSEYDAQDLFKELTDDLLYHGDLNAAMRRLMQQGFQDRDGNQMQGLRDMLDQLRERREEMLDQFDLGGIYDEINETLDDVVAEERDAIEDHVADTAASGDQRANDIAEASSIDKNLQLDMLPPDLAGKVKGLQSYEFMSPEARQQFDELIERLKKEVAQSQFDQMAGAMGEMQPEDLAPMKDMMAELNQMIEQRNQGEEPDFEGFMDRHGDFFPENPESLDELLEIMAERMAAMQAMMNSLTPEQRQQLQELSAQLMDDMDLQWQTQQLAQHLQEAFPDMNWDANYEFGGDQQLNMPEATDVMQQLGDLDSLQQMLQNAPNPSALAEVDPQRVEELLGRESAEALQRMSEMARLLGRERSRAKHRRPA